MGGEQRKKCGELKGQIADATAKLKSATASLAVNREYEQRLTGGSIGLRANVRSAAGDALFVLERAFGRSETISNAIGGVGVAYTMVNGMAESAESLSDRQYSDAALSAFTTAGQTAFGIGELAGVRSFARVNAVLGVGSLLITAAEVSSVAYIDYSGDSRAAAIFGARASQAYSDIFFQSDTLAFRQREWNAWECDKL
jgi:hypothetical protein